MTKQQACKWHKRLWEWCLKGPDGAVPPDGSSKRSPNCFKNCDVLSSSCIWRTQENATRCTQSIYNFSTYILWFELDTQGWWTLASARWDGLYCSQVCSCFLQVNIKTCLESHGFASKRETVVEDGNLTIPALATCTGQPLESSLACYTLVSNIH